MRFPAPAWAPHAASNALLLGRQLPAAAAAHFPSLPLCQSALQVPMAVLEIVYCLGIPDILRAAFIGLSEGHFGGFLGSLHC